MYDRRRMAHLNQDFEVCDLLCIHRKTKISDRPGAQCGDNSRERVRRATTGSLYPRLYSGLLLKSTRRR